MVAVKKMATPVPQVDLFNPLLQELRDQFELRVFSDEGIEASERDVVREYNRHFKLPYVRTLIADVLSGRWGIGRTQEEVSERLGLERSRLSDALRHGELSLDIYMRLRCCPTRPTNWEPDLDQLYDDMDRSGFIGVARYFASLVPDRPVLAPVPLNELNYELMCEMLFSFVTWTIARLNQDHSIATTLVRNVASDPARHINPTWLTNSERKRTQLFLEALLDSPAVAFEHLCNVQSHWQDVVVVSYSQLELVRWNLA